MTDPLDDFLRAYDAWAESEELCAGPLFERMTEAREANGVLEELRAIRKELAEIKDQAATRKQLAALATAVAIIAAAKAEVSS